MLEDVLEARREAAMDVMYCGFEKNPSSILAKLVVKSLESKEYDGCGSTKLSMLSSSSEPTVVINRMEFLALLRSAMEMNDS